MLGHGQTNKLSIFSSTMAEFRTNTHQTTHRHDCDNILPCQNIYTISTALCKLECIYIRIEWALCDWKFGF